MRKIASGTFNMEMWVTLAIDGKTNWYHISMLLYEEKEGKEDEGNGV